MTLLLGYIGPGAGLGFLGSLLAIMVVVALGLLGLVLYPLKIVMGWYRAGLAPHAIDETPSCGTQAGPV